MPRVLASVWGRAFLPSLTDFFFCAILIWLFVAGASGWKSLLMDGDTGWHIRVGEYILDHRAVPTHDLFSFSKASAPWFAWEWLTDVLYAALFRLAGLKAIVLWAGIVIAAYSTIVLRYAIWRGANSLAAGLATLFAIGSGSVHFLARPHLITLLLLPVSMWMLEADRRRNSRAVWLLVPLTAVWTNLHGGFVMFLACLALLVAGSLAEMWLKNAPAQPVFRYGILLLACGAASLVNPYGTNLHVHIWDYLQSGWIRDVVQEFQAPTFRSEGQLQFEALLVAGFILCGFLIQRKKITELLWVLFLGHSSLTSLRHAPLYACVAGPIIASEFSRWWTGWSATQSKSSIGNIVYQMGEDLRFSFRRISLWPVLLVGTLAILDAPIPWPKDFPSEGFPVGMVHQHAALLESGRVLTSDQWGDYLIYTLYPKVKVFVDGRSDFYGETLGHEYLHILQGQYDWEANLKRYGFTVAIVPVEWPLASLLKRSDRWVVVQDDTKAILFVRKPADENESTIAVPERRSY
jgi:hypothetical protein